MLEVDVAVIGGGAAGLAAAIKASENSKVILLDRNDELGGVLPQCIHDGFGNFLFKKMLTGPEYIQFFVDKLKDLQVSIKLETTVIEIKKDKRIIAIGKEGILEIQAGAIVLAMGCREKTRNQILIPGSRPSGIYTAGTAQRLINIEGVIPGRKVVILGSGDIGLIMARRFKLEGAEVVGIYEILSTPNGLPRNIVQCLEDYNIPLYLSHTVVNIHGLDRINGVTVAKVDEKFKPIKDTEKFIPCDTLILAVGLIPENELSGDIGIPIDTITGGPFVDNYMETMIPGFFACGNVVQVYDIVDDVTLTGEIAGRYAALYAKNMLLPSRRIPIFRGRDIDCVVPQFIREDSKEIRLYIRVKRIIRNAEICIRDPNDNIIYKTRRRIVKPAVMEKIQFSIDSFYESLTVEVYG